jgi:hypothetical protein
MHTVWLPRFDYRLYFIEKNNQVGDFLMLEKDIEIICKAAQVC